jgi:hypothetical protein
VIGATGLQTLVHAALSFLTINKTLPYAIHIIMGIAYSGLAASLWPYPFYFLYLIYLLSLTK